MDVAGKVELSGETSGEGVRPELSKARRISQHVLQVASIGFGCIVISLALTSYLTNMGLNDILRWVEQFFGVGFISIFLALLGLGTVALYNVHRQQNVGFWFEVGQQSSNGISTLALTFTLLGISLGIGTLSGQSLTPDNVQSIIGELTRQFSMAFMTTVVGLPTATLLRALLAIRYSALLSRSNEGLQGNADMNINTVAWGDALSTQKQPAQQTQIT